MTINVKKIEARNMKLKDTDTMTVQHIYKTAIVTKDGSQSGKYRYRLAGTGSDGTGMSKFVNEEDAKAVAKHLGKKIQEVQPKPASERKRRTCTQIAENAKTKCEESRERRKERKASKAKPAEKAKPKGKKPKTLEEKAAKASEDASAAAEKAVKKARVAKKAAKVAAEASSPQKPAPKKRGRKPGPKK